MSKTALITGGARGIGRCLVRRFCELGYMVFVLDVDEAELQHTIKIHLRKYSDQGQLGSTLCDLSDTNEIRSKVDEAADFLGGRIHVLVNNGGIASPKWKDGQTMADKETLAQWKAYVFDDKGALFPALTLYVLGFDLADACACFSRISYMDTNLTAPFAVSQACLPYMRHDADSVEARHDNDSNAGPCIILIGSFRALTSDANQEGYASTKAGLLGLMHSMAVSLSRWGIRVNLVAPGRVKVAHECRDGDEKRLRWAEQNESADVDDHLTNRAGRPKDIADAVEYLVSAGFISGQDITVDGGASKKKSS